MLSDLLKLVMRGERGEGKGEGPLGTGGGHLHKIHLPHAKLHNHQNSLKSRSKRFYRSSQGASSSASANSSSSSTSSSYLSQSRRKGGDYVKSFSRSSKKKDKGGKSRKGSSSKNDIYEDFEFKDSLGIGSHHSSKVSLLEGRHQVVDDVEHGLANPVMKWKNWRLLHTLGL